jgi:hypothetical protein
MSGGFFIVPPSLSNFFSSQAIRTFGFAPWFSSFFASSSGSVLPDAGGGPWGVLPTPAAPSAPGLRSQASVCPSAPAPG